MPDSLKYRRRQLYLGVFVLILSMFSVTEGAYFRHQDALQRQCIGDAFTELAQTLTLRGELFQRQTDAITTLITDVFNAKSREQARHIFRVFTRTNNAINEERAKNPVPPFPQGKCDDPAS